MPITTIDPKTALIVIDLQAVMAQIPTAHPFDDVLANAVKLPALNQQPSDKTITKYTWGAFHNTDLADHLTELGVTQVVVCGVATSQGVESTARQAHEHGYHVTLPLDAMTDVDAAAHDNSVAHIFPALGETGSTADVLAALGDRRRARDQLSLPE